MVRDFGAKLRLTAALFGCGSQQELCTRFYEVNPATAFELERSYKWMQGRSLPRSTRIYEDWATLLGTGTSIARLQSCTVAEFLDQICTEHEVSRDVLLARAGLPGPDAGAAAPEMRQALACPQLAGDYACYSPAWSPYFQGRIIRGSLTIQAEADVEAAPALSAAYVEEVSVGSFELRGPVTVLGRSLWLDLVDRELQARLSMCLFMPGVLASVLAGVMSGATLVDADPQPAACRIVMVRVPPDRALGLGLSNRYVDCKQERLSADLAAQGVPIAAPDEVDALLERFLAGDRASDYIKLETGDYSELALAFDRLLVSDGAADAMTPTAPPPQLPT